MKVKSIENVNLNDKKVLLRVDFNVEIENGNIKEEFKIRAPRETIEHVLGQKGAKLALVSHLGRPEGKVDPRYSLRQITDDVEKILGRKTKFCPDCIGEEVKNGLENLKEGEILLLENVRFHPGEEKNDEDFSKRLAKNFDVFINDAFSVCHRDQASVTGITKILPSYAGFWLQKEIESLEKIKNNPEHPAVAVVGGAKIETKLSLIENLEKDYDFILVGGKIANEIFDQNLKFSEKVVLPIDFAEDRLDIGPRTIEKFKEIISQSKTIIWNGPLGKFEEKPYDRGTNEILEAVIKSGAYVLMGGGESVQILEENGKMDKISFVSTGGGAMLEYLSGNPLPGIEALSA